MNKFKFLSISVTVATLMFTGCGSSSSDTDTQTITTDNTQIGTFIDAPVKGLSYKTATQSGLTDENGSFKYISGETVEFKLGDLSLGSTTAISIVTPYTISDNNTTATNIAMLLQNFDSNRSDTAILDLSKLKDYNFSNINLNSSNSDVESQLTTLLATGEFQTYVDDSNLTLVNSAHATNTMNNYLAINSEDTTNDVVTPTISVESGFTEEWLDGRTLWLVWMDNETGQKTEVKATFSNNTITYYSLDGDKIMEESYTIIDGILSVGSNNDDYQGIKVINNAQIDICQDETLSTIQNNCSAQKSDPWYFTTKEAADNF